MIARNGFSVGDAGAVVDGLDGAGSSAGFSFAPQPVNTPMPIRALVPEARPSGKPVALGSWSFSLGFEQRSTGSTGSRGEEPLMVDRRVVPRPRARQAVAADPLGVQSVDDVVDELFERNQVPFELGEHVGSAHAGTHVDSGIEVGDQCYCGITHFELTSQHGLRVAGHIDQWVKPWRTKSTGSRPVENRGP